MSKKKNTETNTIDTSADAIQFVQWLRRTIGQCRVQEFTDERLAELYAEFPASAAAIKEADEKAAAEHAAALEAHAKAVADGRKKQVEDSERI